MADTENGTVGASTLPAEAGDATDRDDSTEPFVEPEGGIMMGTYALFQMVSDWYKSLRMNLKGQNMSGIIPSFLEMGPAMPTPQPPLQMHPKQNTHQSWIELGFQEKFEMGINIGRGAFSSGLRYRKGPPEQGELVMAPVEPGKIKGWDFHIWVLAGPGKLQSIIQSVIDANFEAMKVLLKREWINVNLPMIGRIVINDIKAKKLQCTYAAISKQDRSSSWVLSLVAVFTGEVHGTRAGRAWSHEFTDLKCYISVTINTKDASKVVITVDRLQTTIEGGLGPGNYYIPGAINSTYNKEILKAINEELQKLNVKPVGSLERYNIEDYLKPPPFSGKYAQWMSKPNIQAKKLFELKLPGTHDSAAYMLEKELSQVLYPDQAFLRKLSKDKAPANKNLKEPPFYLGDVAYDYVMEQGSWLGLAHDESRDIKRQLEEGVRFFDIRLYHDSEMKDYYTHHTFRGPKLSAIFEQIQQYARANTSSQEFLIFELSHDNYSNSDHPEKVANMVRDRFGSSIYMPAGYSPEKEYDFQNLKDLPLSSITQGKLKLMFINSNSKNTRYPHSVVNIDSDSLFPKPGAGQKPGDGLYGLYFTFTPGPVDCAGYVMMNVHHPSGKIKVLQRSSRKRNNEVKQALDDPRITRFMMDWYTEADQELPIDLIIKANG